MIDDRKFYYNVDSITEPRPARGRQSNPWRPIGPDESVTMDTDNAYSGKQSPLIQLAGSLPRGIVQAGIVLRNGRAYNGRVVLAGDTGANVTVSLVWGSGPNDRQTIPIQDLRSDYTKFPLEFTAGAETEKFKVGSSTSLLVAQAQRDLVASQIAEIESFANYLKALVSLFQLEGSLLQRRGISASGGEPVILDNKKAHGR